jgi:hypothetical protein
MHVEQVLGDVPPAERCRCHEEREAKRAQSRAESGSWLDRVRKTFGE